MSCICGCISTFIFRWLHTQPFRPLNQAHPVAIGHASSRQTALTFSLMANTPCKQGKSISADFYIACEWGVGIPDLSPFLVRFSMSLNLIAAHLSTKNNVTKCPLKPPTPDLPIHQSSKQKQRTFRNFTKLLSKTSTSFSSCLVMKGPTGPSSSTET